MCVSKRTELHHHRRAMPFKSVLVDKQKYLYLPTASLATHVHRLHPGLAWTGCKGHRFELQVVVGRPVRIVSNLLLAPPLLATSSCSALVMPCVPACKSHTPQHT